MITAEFLHVTVELWPLEFPNGHPEEGSFETAKAHEGVGSPSPHSLRLPVLAM